MGQQLSSESYCVSTIQRLAEELNTTESQVSECSVLSSSGGSVKLQFSWREWRRVSGHLERVLPPAEQRRLLDHLLLDVTALRGADLGSAWEGVLGLPPEEDEDNEVFMAPPTTGLEDAVETSSLSLDATGEWTVHPDWSDGSRGNPLLYRDFAKLHLQLEPVFSAFNLDLTSTMSGTSAVADSEDDHQHFASDENEAAALQEAVPEAPISLSVYGYRASRRLTGVTLADLRAYVAAFSDRVAEILKTLCAKQGINFLATGCQYHPSHNCLVISGTTDVRSLLRQSGGIELRSWANDEAEGQELTDQLQRSIGRGFDGLRESRQLQPPRQRYFPMVMYYCDNRKLVTIIYGLEPKEVTDSVTSGAGGGI